MTRPAILVLALTLAGSVGIVTEPAAAQNAAPALRANVTVSTDVVHIGDLVENAGAVADIAVFRSPDLGTRGAVPTARVVEAIRPYQLIDIDTRGLSEVVVTRASRAITMQEISGRIAKSLEGRYGLGDARNITIEFDRDARTLNVEPNVTEDLQVVSLNYNKRSARFEAVIDLPSSGALHWQTTRYSGTAVETVEAVTVDHPIEHGELLKLSDLTVVRRAKGDGTLISTPQAAVGLAARRQLLPGQPLHDGDLMKPALVQRNDVVTIFYEVPGISLTLRGQAQDAGGLGDTINVINTQSKRVMQATVTGAGRVAVAGMPGRVVVNAPAVVAPAPAASSETPEAEPKVE
jgi:flagellar basal body P-ring formation protein FlgA